MRDLAPAGQIKPVSCRMLQAVSRVQPGGRTEPRGVDEHPVRACEGSGLSVGGDLLADDLHAA